MTIPISVQLYTVRDLAKQDFPGALERIAEIGYIGVEFAGLHGVPPAELAAILKKLDLRVSSAHVGMPTADNIDALVEEAQVLGYRHLISGGSPDDVSSAEKLAAFAGRCARGVELAAAHGLTFGLHNHWWEFDHLIDGRTPFEQLFASVPGLMSELDVYWCEVGGHSAADMVRKHGANLPLLHIKDGPVDPRTPHTAVGSGRLDMPAIVKPANPAMLQWLIVELDDCATDMMEAVAESYRYLTSTGLAAGR
jgi:sugar phosphate isomerase/epimerase